MQFKEIIGNKLLKEKLITDVCSGKIPHAHLFVGDMGFGGTSMALAFIQYILCENKGEHDSCGECNNCKKVQQLEHPDVHFSFPTVQAESKTSDPQFPQWKNMILSAPNSSLNNWITLSDDKGRKPVISVSQSAEIIKKLTLKSFMGGHRVSVIWFAEEMNTACANKLLKIIEEPPSDTIFILLAESEETILPTILSRTQIARIKPIQEEEIVSYLQTKGNYDIELLRSIAAGSEGNLTLAEELLKTDDGSGNSNFNRFVELMRVSYKKQVIPMLNWAEGMSTLGREEQKQFLRYALYMVRQSIMKNYNPTQETFSSKEEEDFLANFARFISGNNVLDFNKLFNDAHYNVERNAHGKLLFTNISFEIMRFIHKA
ncbi:MAG: hypothetical protein H3C31_03690 [Brumimicrobium sp.]|nr:hypothetical protein [Brumimicrobium sp.]MCO5267662.1 hypothetical protein [Brumimicrobium sp.]